jgi:hypothetical protein
MATKKPTAVQIKARLKDPGERSKLADKYLTPAQRQQRAMNTRLNAPVVAGSTLTQRDVARQATAGADVKYGDAIRQQQTGIDQSAQLQKDQAGWFDDYQRKLADAQAGTQQIGAQTTQAIGNLAGAFQAPNTAGFSAGNADDATKAAAVRKAILGNLGAVQAAQAGNANTYANTMANVVAPGQKLSAQAQGAGKTQSLRDQLTGLLKEKGTYKQQLESDAVAAEGKNVLAQQALGLDITKADTQAKQTAAQQTETARHNKASETTAANDPSKKKTQAELDFFNKHGYWPSTGPPSTPKGKSPYLGTSGQTSFKNDLSSTRSLVSKYKGQYTRQELASILTSPEGRPATTVYIDPKTRKPIKVNGIPVTDPTAAKKQNPDAVKLTLPAIPHVSNSAAISAALDEIYDGHLSPATVRKLHDAGIKVNPLGISTKRTAKRTKPSTVSKTSNPPVFSSGGVTPIGPVGVQ